MKVVCVQLRWWESVQRACSQRELKRSKRKVVLDSREVEICPESFQPKRIEVTHKQGQLCTAYLTLFVRHSTAISYRPLKTYSTAVRAIPLSACHQGPPRGSNAQQFIQLTVVGDINAKSGWSLKTEKIHLLWHVYNDTTHTSWHPFLTWTSLYLSTFLKT